MKKLVAISSLVFFSCLPPAAAKQTYNVHLSVTKVEVGCINGNGTVTAGKGSGGYGCNYPEGDSVSCNKKGNCTYTIPDAHKAGTTNNLRINGAVNAVNRKNGGGAPNGTNITKPNALMNRSPAAARLPLHP